jgi:hypothetical protein
MLTYPTTDRLRELGLAGMARALEEQRRHPDATDLGFEDRLAMLVEREALERDTKRLATRLRFASVFRRCRPGIPILIRAPFQSDGAHHSNLMAPR